MDRLRQRADFLAVASGARINRAAFLLQSRRRDDDGPIRVGFTVTKKNGTATERNRIRRRLRAVVSELAGELRPGAYLVSVNPEAPGLSYEELKTKVARAMASASRQSDR